MLISIIFILCVCQLRKLPAHEELSFIITNPPAEQVDAYKALVVQPSSDSDIARKLDGLGDTEL
jgi:hypothetical protein